MNILVFNPGGNSLKAEIIRCQPGQQHAFEGETLISVIIEGIGKEAKIARYTSFQTRLGTYVTVAYFISHSAGVHCSR